MTDEEQRTRRVVETDAFREAKQRSASISPTYSIPALGLVLQRIADELHELNANLDSLHSTYAERSSRRS